MFSQRYWPTRFFPDRYWPNGSSDIPDVGTPALTLFTRHTRDEHAKVLADYLPGGDIFGGKSDQSTNLYKLLLGLAEQPRLVEENLELTFEQFDITTTTDFLEEWERALGIPDDCLSGTGTAAERRRDVNAKFLSDSVVTADDFIALAALFGVEVTIQNGFDALANFPFTFPITFPDVRAARFTMIVAFTVTESQRFTFTFPIEFGDAVIEILQCIFRNLAPANVDVVFQQV